MGVDGKIIEKIQKLLALAKSDNEHEAALATARAQELLDRHNLSMAELKDPIADDGIRQIENTDAARLEARKIRPHVSRLFSGLAYQFDCVPIVYATREWRTTSRGRMRRKVVHQKMGIVGHKQDIEVVLFMYNYLLRAVEKIYRLELKREREKRAEDGMEMPRSRKNLFKKSYLSGATSRILDEVRAERAARLKKDEKCTALVVQRQQKVQDWMKDNLNVKTSRRKKRMERVDGEAWWKGHDQAGNIKLRKGVSQGKSVRTKHITT